MWQIAESILELNAGFVLWFIIRNLIAGLQIGDTLSTFFGNSSLPLNMCDRQVVFSPYSFNAFC